MIQLIIDTAENGITLPEVIRGGYRAWKEDLSVETVMISGRMTKELRGRVWRVKYDRGYLDDTMKDAVISACEKGRETPITCQFLPPNSAELLTRQFFVTAFQYPTFQWSMESTPLWVNFSMELREVKPSD